MPDPIAIPRIRPPSKDAFRRDFVLRNEPVVIEGLVDAWPGATRWSPEYYGSAYGHVQVTVARTQQNGTLVMDLAGGLNYREIPLRDYVESMQAVASDGDYVIAEIERFPEQFQNELVVPEYCRGAPWLRSKLWFGSKGTVTQMHRGAPENLYSVVTGCKRFVMYRPADTRAMYPYSVFSKLPNFSPVDVENPDYQSFPKLRDAQAWEVDLHDGDTLYIPRFWWHQVRTVESTIAVNFWWARGYTMLISAAAHVYKKLRGLST